MKNQLSKREYKYRCKIIAENHLKKSDQRLLDSYKKESYKNLYCDKNKLAIFISTVSVRNLSAGVCQIGNSAAEVAKAFNDMSRVLQGVYDSLGCSIIHTRWNNGFIVKWRFWAIIEILLKI